MNAEYNKRTRIYKVNLKKLRDKKHNTNGEIQYKTFIFLCYTNTNTNKNPNKINKSKCKKKLKKKNNENNACVFLRLYL